MSSRRRVAVPVLLSLLVAGGAIARDRGDVTPPRPTGPQEVEVARFLVDQAGQQPAIVLQGKRDKRVVTMAIDATQVIAIALPLQGVTPPRPMTHDLFLTMFGKLKVTVSKVVVTDFRDDVYYANVHLQTGHGEMVLDARPSDAIALAIRAKVPMLVEDKVFEKTGTPAGLPKRQHI
jgi:hypothetical protein